MSPEQTTEIGAQWEPWLRVPFTTGHGRLLHSRAAPNIRNPEADRVTPVAIFEMQWRQEPTQQIKQEPMTVGTRDNKTSFLGMCVPNARLPRRLEFDIVELGLDGRTDLLYALQRCIQSCIASQSSESTNHKSRHRQCLREVQCAIELARMPPNSPGHVPIGRSWYAYVSIDLLLARALLPTPHISFARALCCTTLPMLAINGMRTALQHPKWRRLATPLSVRRLLALFVVRIAREFSAPLKWTPFQNAAISCQRLGGQEQSATAIQLDAQPKGHWARPTAAMYRNRLVRISYANPESSGADPQAFSVVRLVTAARSELGVHIVVEPALDELPIPPLTKERGRQNVVPITDGMQVAVALVLDSDVSSCMHVYERLGQESPQFNTLSISFNAIA